MNSILIAELFGVLHECVGDHIKAGRSTEALALLSRLQTMNVDFAARGQRLFPLKHNGSNFTLHSEN